MAASKALWHVGTVEGDRQPVVLPGDQDLESGHRRSPTRRVVAPPGRELRPALEEPVGGRLGHQSLGDRRGHRRCAAGRPVWWRPAGRSARWTRWRPAVAGRPRGRRRPTPASGVPGPPPPPPPRRAGSGGSASRVRRACPAARSPSTSTTSAARVGHPLVGFAGTEDPRRTPGRRAARGPFPTMVTTDGRRRRVTLDQEEGTDG